MSLSLQRQKLLFSPRDIYPSASTGNLYQSCWRKCGEKPSKKEKRQPHNKRERILIRRVRERVNLVWQSVSLLGCCPGLGMRLLCWNMENSTGTCCNAMNDYHSLPMPGRTHQKGHCRSHLVAQSFSVVASPHIPEAAQMLLYNQGAAFSMSRSTTLHALQAHI